MNSDQIVNIGFIILLIIFGVTVVGGISNTVFVENPKHNAFCLDQGFSHWEYASEATGINKSIVCSDRGRVKYFNYEDGEYYEIKKESVL